MTYSVLMLSGNLSGVFPSHRAYLTNKSVTQAMSVKNREYAGRRTHSEEGLLQALRKVREYRPPWAWQHVCRQTGH
jgi:hypothetical protein